MNRLRHDVRHAWRTIRRSPNFTIAIVLSLGLAIGVNTAIFTFLNTILLHSLPFADADRLVRIREVWLEPGKDPMPVSVSPMSLDAWQKTASSFVGLAVHQPSDFNITGGEEPESVFGGFVSSSFLPVLGVEPALGRGILPEEDRPGAAAPVVLISDSLWRRRFGADPSAVGGTLTLNQQGHTIVGVLPPRFRFPYEAEVWVPMGLNPLATERRHQRYLNVFARLRPGVGAERAGVELKSLGRNLAKEHPDTHSGWSTEIKAMRDDMVGDVRPRLLALSAAAAFVLLLACANAANLLLVRSLEQGHDLSLRVALGARRADLVRQLLAQSLLLALVAGGFGVLLAYASLGPLVRLSPIQDLDLHFQDSLRIDLRVLAFSLLVSLLVGLLFGLLPALNASRSRVQTVLQERSRSSGGLRGQRWLAGVMVCEIALAVVLLGGAGLMLKSFRQLQSVDLGFEEEDLLLMEIALPESKYPERHQQVAFFEELLERLRPLPGVRSASVTTSHPYSNERMAAPFIVEGRPPARPGEFFITNHRVVSPGYLETMGIPLLEGRTFTPADREGTQPVVIVSKRFATTYWPGQSALGKRVQRSRPEAPWLNVVGVVGDVKDAGDFKETWYVPYLQDWRLATAPMALVVRTRVEPLSLSDEIRQVVHAIDPDQPVSSVEAMETIAFELLRPERFATLLYTLFGGLALILAAVGIYGVMSFAVSRRSQEFGIRMALGARAVELRSLVLRRALALTLAGLLIGAVGALALTRFLSSLLFEVSPNDPLTFLAVAVTLAAVALGASYLPARKAARVDPIAVVRAQ